MRNRRIRVLVVDDSRTAREVIRSFFEGEPDFEVVGTAGNGGEAVQMASALRPDIITLDLVLPDMDGLEVAGRVMAQAPTRILVVSRVLDREEPFSTSQALQVGALDAVHKGSLITLESKERMRQDLLSRARALCRIKPLLHMQGRPFPRRNGKPVPRPLRLVVFASSTGGPVVLRGAFSGLPADYPVPILVVQHLTPGFEQGLANWLAAATPLEVRVAAQGDRLRPGQVLLAPQGRQLAVTPYGCISLHRGTPDRLHCPCADYTLTLAADHYRCALAAVVLSGLGNDGTAGMAAVKAQGGVTFAQDPDTCAAPSMPRAALAAGLVDALLTPDQIAPALLEVNQEEVPI